MKNATVQLEGAEATLTAAPLEVHTVHDEVSDAITAHEAAATELSRRHGKVLAIDTEIAKLKSDRHGIIALLAGDLAESKRSAAHATVDAIDAALLRLARELEAASTAMIAAQQAVESTDAKRLAAIEAAARAERHEQRRELTERITAVAADHLSHFRAAALSLGEVCQLADALAALDTNPLGLLDSLLNLPGGGTFLLASAPELRAPTGWGARWHFELRPLVKV